MGYKEQGSIPDKKEPDATPAVEKPINPPHLQIRTDVRNKINGLTEKVPIKSATYDYDLQKICFVLMLITFYFAGMYTVQGAKEWDDYIRGQKCRNRNIVNIFWIKKITRENIVHCVGLQQNQNIAWDFEKIVWTKFTKIILKVIFWDYM